jgi:hypothetical protein
MPGRGDDPACPGCPARTSCKAWDIAAVEARPEPAVGTTAPASTINHQKPVADACRPGPSPRRWKARTASRFRPAKKIPERLQEREQVPGPERFRTPRSICPINLFQVSRNLQPDRLGDSRRSKSRWLLSAALRTGKLAVARRPAGERCCLASRARHNVALRNDIARGNNFARGPRKRAWHDSANSGVFWGGNDVARPGFAPEPGDDLRTVRTRHDTAAKRRQPRLHPAGFRA